VLKKNICILVLIFAFAIFIRFINFHESVYFGYDEARDAYDSQAIYLKGDFKLSGPPASIFKGINHGPLYLYLIGPLFLLGHGDPYFVSAVFRLINASGVFLMYILGSLYIGPAVGLIAAFIYAVSFEQYIYAIFTGNPALSNIFWPILFIGAGIIHRKNGKRLFGLFLMLFAASSITQFDLILSYSFATLGILLYLLRKKLIGIPIKSWVKISLLGLTPLYSYPLAEFRNHFLGVKTFISMIAGRVNILSEGESFYLLFLKNFIRLFSDNIIYFSLPLFASFVLFLAFLIFLFLKAIKNHLIFFILIWIGSILFLLTTKGFMPYYAYAGVGIGVIFGMSILINEIQNRNLFISFLLLGIIVTSNLLLITKQSKKALIVEIKAQPGMKLSDEINIVRKTYELADNKGFTIRTTTMPYKIQTVWSYLYKEYGLPTYGYLPYLEGGNTGGYPGELPAPIHGTTCTRFYIREPVRGIPEVLINNDINEENLFSDVVKEDDFGDFLLQTRKAKASDCHVTKSQNVISY
jgi:hypothetical protein